MWQYMWWGCCNMKKLKNIMIIFVMCIIFVFSFPIVDGIARADSSQKPVDYKIQIEAILKDFVSSSSRQNRFACSENEYNSANYIAEKMTSYGLTAVNNQSTQNGFQYFDVQTDAGLYRSQNVIYKKIGSSSDKKVILATHYDSAYYYGEEDEYTEKHGSEDASESGAGVATLLLAAQALSYYTFDFDIEFVFFGAHNENLAGSAYYTSFISSEVADSILLMINLDNLVSDGKIYLYNGEFKNNSDDYVESAFAKNFNIRNLSDYEVLSYSGESSVTGLDYTNFVLKSDNAHFIRVGVKSLSLTSFSDSCVNSLGVVSYKPIIDIANDTEKNINEKTNGVYLSNLSLIVNGCINLLTDTEFKNQLSGGYDNSIYKLFGNSKLWIFVACILFVVICFVAQLIKYILEKQAQKAKEDLQIEKVIATISPSDFEDMDALMERLTSEFEKTMKEHEEKNKQKKENDNKHNKEKKED